MIRPWRTKLMKREKDENVKKTTFDLNFLLAPTRAHQFYIDICIQIISLTTSACFLPGCLMAQWVLGRRKQHQDVFNQYFKLDYYDAPMVTQIFWCVIVMPAMWGFKNCFPFVGSMMAHNFMATETWSPRKVCFWAQNFDIFFLKNKTRETAKTGRLYSWVDIAPSWFF